MAWLYARGDSLLGYLLRNKKVVKYEVSFIKYAGCPKKIVPFSKISLCAPDVILGFCAHGNGGYFIQS
jgi:hypothetical protein